jgi:hypothetical protein
MNGSWPNARPPHAKPQIVRDTISLRCPQRAARYALARSKLTCLGGCMARARLRPHAPS